MSALSLHWILERIPGFYPSLYLSAGIVTILVATPLIVYSQILIQTLGQSRHALKRMTERLALALDEAEQASRAKSSFVANMSHELRTPLNAIIGFSDVMRNQSLGTIENARYLDYAKDINESGIHLLSIINEILDLSKIEAGRATLEKPSAFDLVPVLERAVRVTQPLSDKQRVTVNFEIAIEQRDVRLLAIERMVRQVALNILSNAVKFTPAGGTVALGLDWIGDNELAIRVTDTGIGMSSEEIKLALTPFGQVDNVLSRAHSGTGLGLPLAKAMMELMGGRLVITSAPGRGTTVAMVFRSEQVIVRDNQQRPWHPRCIGT